MVHAIPHTKISNRIFRTHRYTNDTSRLICLICVETTDKLYTNA